MHSCLNKYGQQQHRKMHIMSKKVEKCIVHFYYLTLSIWYSLPLHSFFIINCILIESNMRRRCYWLLHVFTQSLIEACGLTMSGLIKRMEFQAAGRRRMLTLAITEINGAWIEVGNYLKIIDQRPVARIKYDDKVKLDGHCLKAKAWHAWCHQQFDIYSIVWPSYAKVGHFFNGVTMENFVGFAAIVIDMQNAHKMSIFLFIKNTFEKSSTVIRTTK